MFTGIVSALGRVASVSGNDRLRRLRIEAPDDPETIALGASISCSGICLTVVGIGGHPGACWFDVDIAAETLARTTASSWQESTFLNLERSLALGAEIGGHLVTGHVDGVAQILTREDLTSGDEPWGPSVRFQVKAPKPLHRLIAQKGSICLDGTSLTVNVVQDDVFSILLIPHTLKVTTWGKRKVGDALNLEVDLMARYAARLAQTSEAG